MQKVQVFVPERLLLNQNKIQVLVENEKGKGIQFWITFESTFNELCKDATRFYFNQCHHDSFCTKKRVNVANSKSSSDLEIHRAIKNNIAKFILVDEQGQSWPDKGRVFFHLSALPRKGLRTITLALKTYQDVVHIHRTASICETSSPTSPWSVSSKLERQSTHIVRSRTTDKVPTAKDSSLKHGTHGNRLPLEAFTSERSKTSKVSKFKFQEMLHEELWRIFSFYCLKGNLHQPDQMTFKQMSKLLDDCGIQSLLCKSHLEIIFKTRTVHEHVRVSNGHTVKKTKSGTQHLLTYGSFLDVLLDISKIVYPNIATPRGALGHLIANHIAPNAKSWTYAPHVLQYRNHSDMTRIFPVQRLRQRFTESLHTIFDAYAVSHKVSTSSNLKLLEYSKFLSFINDFKLVSLGVQKIQISEIFLSCCRKHGLSNNNNKKHKYPNQSELANGYSGKTDAYAYNETLRMHVRFDEFVDALLRIAFFSFAVCTNTQQSIECVKKRLIICPEVAVKALLHHIYSNVLSSPRSMNELLAKANHPGWSNGMQILSAAQAFNREFERVWHSDGCPESYYQFTKSIGTSKKSISLENTQTKGKNILRSSFDAITEQATDFCDDTTPANKPELDEELRSIEENKLIARPMSQSSNNELQNPEDNVACDGADYYFESATEACCRLATRLILCLSDQILNLKEENVAEVNREIERVAQLCNCANMIYNSIMQKKQGKIAKPNQCYIRRNIAIQRLCSRFLCVCAGSSEKRRNVLGSEWFVSLWNWNQVKCSNTSLAASQLLKLIDMLHACVEESCKELEDFLGADDNEITLLQLAMTLRYITSLKIVSLGLRMVIIDKHSEKKSSSNMISQLQLFFRYSEIIDSNYKKLELLYTRLQDATAFQKNHMGNFSHMLFERAICTCFKIAASTLARQKSQLDLSCRSSEVHDDNNILNWVLSDDQIQEQHLSIKKYLFQSRRLCEKLFDFYAKNESNQRNNASSVQEICEVRIVMLWTWTSVIDLEKSITSFVKLLMKRESVQYEFQFFRGKYFEFGSGAEILMGLNDEGGSLLTSAGGKACNVIFKRFDRNRKGRLDRNDIIDLLRYMQINEEGKEMNDYLTFMRSLGYISTKLTSDSNSSEIDLSIYMTPAGFRSFFVWNLINAPMATTKFLLKVDTLRHFFEISDTGIESDDIKSNVLSRRIVHLIRSEILPQDKYSQLFGEAVIKQRKTGPRRDKIFKVKRDENEKEALNTDIENSDSVCVDEVCANAKLVDYFAVVAPGKVRESINMVNVSNPEDVEFVPEIISLWPPHPQSAEACQLPTDAEQASIKMMHDQYPVPDDLPTFCFPYGANVREMPNRVHPDYYTFSFVLTNSSGLKRFGFCLVFYEEISMRNLASNIMRRNNCTVPSWMCGGKPTPASHGQTQGDHDICDYEETSIFSPTCLCLVSRWPYFNVFNRFLVQIYKISKSSPPHPLETYISTFVNNTPVPPRGNTQVQVVLGDMGIYISRPPKNHLPMRNFSFKALFERLSINNIIFLISALLQEKKIVLCSANIGILTPVAETLRALIFPFQLQSVYIPLLPQSMYEFLFAPVPYLMGIHSKYIESAEMVTSNISSSQSMVMSNNEVVTGSGQIDTPRIFEATNIQPTDALFVDLDSDRFLVSDSNIDLAIGKIAPIPEAIHKKLKRNLEKALETLKRMTMKTLAYQRNGLSRGNANHRKVTFHKLSTIEARISHSNTSTWSAASRVPRSKYDSREWNHAVQNSFLDMFVTLLFDYKKYMRVEKVHKGISGSQNDFVLAGDKHELFDEARFLAEHPYSREFSESLFDSQLFYQFVLAQKLRIQGIEDANAFKTLTTYDEDELELFDSMIKFKQNNRKLKSMYLPKQQKSNHYIDQSSHAITETVFVQLQQPPNDSNGKIEQRESIWEYDKFPVLHLGMMRSRTHKKHLLPVKKVRIDEVLPVLKVADESENQMTIEFSEIIEAKSQFKKMLDRTNRQTARRLSYALCESIVLSLVYEVELEGLRKQLDMKEALLCH